jgi:hypothetical protein
MNHALRLILPALSSALICACSSSSDSSAVAGDASVETSSVPGDGGVGAPCNVDSDCASQLFCAGNSQRYCSATCNGSCSQFGDFLCVYNYCRPPCGSSPCEVGTCTASNQGVQFCEWGK